MKWLIAGCLVALSIALLGASVASTPSPAPTRLSKWQQHELEMFENSAPADEYFGRMKMSFLGINNTFRDAAISSGDHTTDPGVAHKVALAEDALDAWAKKYPRDPQLARTYFLASVAERKIWIRANQQRAWTYLNRLEQRFADSYFGRLVKKNLEIGFTEHYYALPVACPMPATAVTTISDVSTAYATPIPAATPTALFTYPAMASPDPTETTLEMGLKVQILPQACVPLVTSALQKTNAN